MVMRVSRIRAGASFLLLISASLMACGESSTPAGTSGPELLSSFEPTGCRFQIAPRAEYKDFSAGRPQVGPNPDIRRVRLGLGGNVTPGGDGRANPAASAGFAWQTDDGTLASEVTWGSTPDPAAWPAENRTNGVTWLTPEGMIAPNGDQRMHEAYVCGLSPATTYYYRVGGGPAGSESWSEVHSFTTTPTDPNATVTIGITGDSRGQENDAWGLVQRRMMMAGVDLQLFSGDMINLATDQGEWERWLDRAWRDTDDSLSTLGQILALSAHGNHDNHTALYFGNLVLPQEPVKYPKYGELFFSVDVGPVHIIVIDDAWIGFPNGDPDFVSVFTEWLRADLDAAKANRANVPWIVPVHHHHEYSVSNHGDDDDVLKVRAFFTPIWDEYHVDMVINGHSHNYERSKPLTGPADNPTVQTSFADGTVYVVCAGVGAPAYSAGTSPFLEVTRDYKTSGAIGLYGILTATKTSLKLSAHELRTDGSDPMFDEVTITP
jgi:hypothetical protein